MSESDKTPTDEKENTNTGDSIESVTSVLTQLSVGNGNDNVILFQPNMEFASTLIDMGFSENFIERAALATNQMHRGKSKSNLKTLNISISLYCWHLMSGGVLH